MEAIQSVVEIMLCPDSILQNPEEADYVGLIYEWEAEKNGLVPWFKYEKEGESLFILTYKKNPDYVYQTERMQGNLKVTDIIGKQGISDGKIISVIKSHFEVIKETLEFYPSYFINRFAEAIK